MQTLFKPMLVMAALAGLWVSAGSGASADDRLLPQPLAERETITVGISARLTAFAPALLGVAFGEFDKENVDVEFVIVKPSDALVLLATGRLDVVGSQPSAAFFNAVASGSNLKWVGSGSFPAPESKQGLWMSTAYLNGREYSPELLEGQEIASAIGAGSTSSVIIQAELAKVGLGLEDISFRQLSAPDILAALESGAVTVGYLTDPIWLKADPDKVVPIMQMPGDYAQGGWFFGENLLEKRRPAGEAFMRVVSRISTEYLQGNYLENPQVVDALVKELEVPRETVVSGVPLVFRADVDIPEGNEQMIQSSYLTSPGVLNYTEALPSDRVVDRSFLPLVN